jgi:DNA-binding transcriptional MocR family regulator
MLPYSERSVDELNNEYRQAVAHFELCKAKKLDLNIARGKPSKAQLDQVSDFLQTVLTKEDCIVDGVDVRNYGELSGIACAKEYWADILGCKPEQVFIGGSSSLNIMFDVISRAFSHGLLNSVRPWSKEEKVKFLCPAPGYDRHFLVTQFFGAELITVPMTAEGPDMDVVEELVKDSQVKGIWCVPKYSNPDGIIYSDETVRRFAKLKPAAPDFTIMWDNAYCIHEFEGDYVPFPDIISMCEQEGNPHMVFEFASTSKITFAGSGFSAVASSKANIEYLCKLFAVQIISHDKVNQIRHVRYLKNKAHTLEIMKLHAAYLAPKFRVVLDTLEQQIGPLAIANWNRPKGGYFISFNAMPGTAKRTLALCREAGVIFTPAGATYPYGVDPADSNIRVAPSLPPVEELIEAMDVFCTCVKISALEKLLNK